MFWSLDSISLLFLSISSLYLTHPPLFPFLSFSFIANYLYSILDFTNTLSWLESYGQWMKKDGCHFPKLSPRSIMKFHFLFLPHGVLSVFPYFCVLVFLLIQLWSCILVLKLRNATVETLGSSSVYCYSQHSTKRQHWKEGPREERSGIYIHLYIISLDKGSNGHNIKWTKA